MYTEKSGHLIPSAAPGAVSVSGTGLGTYTQVCISQCTPNRLVCVVNAAVTGGTAAVVQFIFRPTPGSSTAQTVLGTITIPDGTGIGKAVYKDISDVSNTLTPGGQLVFNCSTADSAGSVWCGVEVCDSPANALAVTNMIKSA
jgi:hypothetical protein